jgi:hypothetical protein
MKRKKKAELQESKTARKKIYREEDKGRCNDKECEAKDVKKIILLRKDRSREE